jgi:hypothetical protein
MGGRPSVAGDPNESSRTLADAIAVGALGHALIIFLALELRIPE